LVDSPANEEEFVVIKRLNEEEENIMGDVNVTNAEPATGEGSVEKNEGKQEGAEKVTVEVAKASSEAVATAMAQVTTLVEGIAKAAGVGESSDAESEGESDVEKAAAPARKLFKAQLEKAGVKGDALIKAMADFDKAGFPFGKEPDKKDVKKSEGETADADTEKAADADEDAVSKSLDMLGDAIQKAKTFTPKRQEAIKSAIETLSKLLADMTKVPTGGSPSTSTPSNASFGASGVVALTKGLETLVETIKTQLGDLSEVTKGLGDRVGAIEKARTPSTSVEGEGGTDTKTEKKGDLWSGVL
jgi:hypothetical protein